MASTIHYDIRIQRSKVQGHIAMWVCSFRARLWTRVNSGGETGMKCIELKANLWKIPIIISCVKCYSSLAVETKWHFKNSKIYFWRLGVKTQVQMKCKQTFYSINFEYTNLAAIWAEFWNIFVQQMGNYNFWLGLMFRVPSFVIFELIY